MRGARAATPGGPLPGPLTDLPSQPFLGLSPNSLHLTAYTNSMYKGLMVTEHGRALRDSGLTQSRLAELLGISPQYMSNIIHGRNRPLHPSRYELKLTSYVTSHQLAAILRTSARCPECGR